MSAYSYAIYDVFTDKPGAGNPLAVVFAADALSDTQMQNVARDFNLSETVFVRTAADTKHAASVRIFTPTKELPFAGHPTIGCAIALAEQKYSPGDPSDTLFVLEEKIGPVRCAVKIADHGASFAEFTAPALSAAAGPDPSIADAASALGLSPQDIGFAAHAPSLFSAGVKFVMVPIASLDALARATPRTGKLSQELGATEVYLYARAEAGGAHAFRARMFAPETGVAEDAATGSAAAAFAGVLARFEGLGDGWHSLPIQQGVEMGRPSLIGLEVNIENGGLAGARIAGKAVKTRDGEIAIA